MDCYLVNHYLPVRIREGLDVEVRGRPGEEKLGQPAAVPPSGPGNINQVMSYFKLSGQWT